MNHSPNDPSAYFSNTGAQVFSGTGTLSAQRIWKPSRLLTEPSRWRLVRLLERERATNEPEDRSDSFEDVEDARRWRCMRFGSTSGTLAMRAKRESTSSEERMNVSIDFERTWRGACIPSTTETIPQRFIGAMELKDGELDIGDSSVTNTRCEFAVNQ